MFCVRNDHAIGLTDIVYQHSSFNIMSTKILEKHSIKTITETPLQWCSQENLCPQKSLNDYQCALHSLRSAKCAPPQSIGSCDHQSRVENYKPAQQISMRCVRRIVINYLYRSLISLYLYSLNKMIKHHN